MCRAVANRLAWIGRLDSDHASIDTAGEED
jgi:hypothetical protein